MTTRAANGLRSLTKPCSSNIKSSKRAIDVTGAISVDPGLINQTAKLELKVNQKIIFFKILFLKRKLARKLIAKEKERYKNQKKITLPL